MKLLIAIISIFICSTAFSQVKVGVEGIIPTGNFPSHYDSLGAGGLMNVKGIAERNAIPTSRRKRMLVYVTDSSKFYLLRTGITNSDWYEYKPGKVTQLNDSTLTIANMAGNADTIQLQLPPVTFAGTVTSVGLQMADVIYNASVTNSPVTSSGTLIPTLKTQLANAILSGPTTGSAATPTFRSLVAADIPALAESNVTNLTTDLAAKLPLSGGTLTGPLLFTDNTYDIGASAATRPRSIYAGTLAYLGQTGGLIVGKWPQGANYGFIGSLGLTSSTTNYNVLITANGTMNLNAPSGQTVSIGVNNVMNTSFSSTAIAFTLPVTLQKLQGSGTAPTVVLGSNITGSVAATGTDLAGTVTVTVTGVSSLATLNELFTLTFNSAKSTTPFVVFSNASAQAATMELGAGLYVKNAGTTSFQIATSGSYTTPASATYSFNYHVIQ